MDTYVIEYKCYDSKGVMMKSGTMRVKNKTNDFVAKCSLENHLKRKLPNMDKLIVLSCKVDNGLFDFRKIFGKGF
ncbi:MAG: hypothetical protein WCJ72_11165 [Chryseobacterium sp.]|jgi:hypothetical protein